jgi:hypothetical protein
MRSDARYQDEAGTALNIVKGGVMSDQSRHGAGDIAHEMGEHEREARERDADEQDPGTGVEDPESDARTAKPAPPESASTGKLGGGT